ncbi:hypothetical protein [Streptomyces sp. Da 82-17]|uniref:hypothetical protein n=1 Tax=Streptomyces sp. Da 82-17 TaxID=3377116 RepID=UPI0038D47B38
MIKHVRVCAAAAAVVAALALTGCSSDDGGGKRKGGSSAAEDGAQDTTGGGSDGVDNSGSGAKGGIEGLWVAVNNGKSVALSVQQGGKVAVLAEMGVGEKTGTTCVGKATTATIDLKCQGGGEREAGKIESVDATSMTVAWDGAGTDSFKKTDESKLPQGLPTGMPTDMPTDMPQG